MENLQTHNPSQGAVLNSYKPTQPDEFEDRIRSSYWRFHSWKRENVKDRAAFLANLAGLLNAEKERLASLITTEMGKPITQSRQEIEKCAWLCDYYRDRAPEFLKDEHVVTDKKESFISYQPLGPILCIMPWNFPFWQVFRVAVPAITAGNTVLLKHAHNTTGCALEIHDLFTRANYPDFTFQSLIVGHNEVESLIARDEICAVSVTGSEATGRHVAELAGRCLKKTVLELGGSDAYVVLSDADLDHAVKTCLRARLVNSGQSCIAAKRMIISDEVYDEFVARFIKEAENIRVGAPMEEETQVGPLAREDLLEQLDRQVQESVRKGAKLLLGGKRLAQEGFYYAVTVLGDVSPGMPAFDEETFGPVAALVRAEDDEQAIEWANLSRYGLGAAVFTESVDDGRRIARERLEAGVCTINSQVQSDPRLPFGGIKNSGYGRELGILGLREFVNIKTVYREGRIH